MQYLSSYLPSRRFLQHQIALWLFIGTFAQPLLACDYFTSEPDSTRQSSIPACDSLATRSVAKGVQKSVYLWSEELGKFDNDRILQVLKDENFDRLILTAGQPASMEKAYDLQKRACRRGIAVEFLLAPSWWVRSGEPQDVRERLTGLNLRGSPLHLDVEPHIFDDFDRKKQQYLRRYVEVIRQADRLVNNELMVSIPFFWPPETHQKISEVVDRAYIMVYGEKTLENRIEHSLDAARYFDPSQRAVALRPEDFSDRSVISDRTIPALREAVNTNDFAIHDFESVMKSRQ